MAIKTASNGIIAKLTACITCAQCDERMQYDSRNDQEGEIRQGYWCCPNLHLPEPDEEIYQQVRRIIEAAGDHNFGMPYGPMDLPPSAVLDRMRAESWPEGVG